MFHIMDKKMSVVFKEEITELILEIIVNTSPVSKELKTTVIGPYSCKQYIFIPCGFAAEYEKILCQDETCSFGWAIGLRVWIEMVLRSILYVFLIWVYSRSRTGCVEYLGLH